jgi:hypothetical protein
MRGKEKKRMKRERERERERERGIDGMMFIHHYSQFNQ